MQKFIVNPIKEEVLEKYQKLKKKFKNKVEELLFIRSNFNRNMIQDIYTTATTVNEDVDEDADKRDPRELVEEEHRKRFEKFNFKTEIKRPYLRIFAIIMLASFIGFAWIGTGASQSSYSKFIGPQVIISKGSAGALLAVSSFMMISVSYDLLSWFRARWRKRCLAWLDHNIVIHRFCGYVVTIYGVIHSIFHLSGSMIKISSTDDPNEIKKNFHHYEYDTKRTYVEILFGSMTGWTGFILLIVIVLMAVTSFKCVRTRWFQVFGYTHMLLFPIFFALLMIHGLGFWLNWGVPFAWIFIFPGFLLLMIQEITRLLSSWRYKFQVADWSLSPDKKFIMISLIKPVNYNLKHGQFCFINIPSIHPLQWHPFTIVSSPSNPYLVLMIKKAGDWTQKLIHRFYEVKKRTIRYYDLGIKNYEEFDVFNMLHDIHQDIPIKLKKDRNKLFYPMIQISNPCPTPCETFMERENLIMIGAGSGIAPFLPFLEEAMRLDKGKENNYLAQNQNFWKSCFMIFVAREGEQISWVSNYLFHLLTTEWMIPQFEFYIYITMK